MKKKTIPVLITAVVGLLMIVDYFFKIPAVNTSSATLRSWGVIVCTFAEGIGAVNLITIHLRRLSASSKSRLQGTESVVLIGSLILMALFVVFLGNNAAPTVFMYDGIISPVETAVFSMLAMFIGSAAYRAFRIRNTESTILLVVAALVLLGKVPAGQAMFPWLAKPAQWVMDYLNVAGQRGIIIGSGIAFIAISLRVILGLERSYLGESH